MWGDNCCLTSWKRPFDSQMDASCIKVFDNSTVVRQRLDINKMIISDVTLHIPRSNPACISIRPWHGFKFVRVTYVSSSPRALLFHFRSQRLTKHGNQEMDGMKLPDTYLGMHSVGKHITSPNLSAPVLHMILFFCDVYRPFFAGGGRGATFTSGSESIDDVKSCPLIGIWLGESGVGEGDHEIELQR
jgi:hypothetical protein